MNVGSEYAELHVAVSICSLHASNTCSWGDHWHMALVDPAPGKMSLGHADPLVHDLMLSDSKSCVLDALFQMAVMSDARLLATANTAEAWSASVDLDRNSLCIN